jgi:hypothetical protein
MAVPDCAPYLMELPAKIKPDNPALLTSRRALSSETLLSTYLQLALELSIVVVTAPFAFTVR